MREGLGEDVAVLEGERRSGSERASERVGGVAQEDELAVPSVEMVEVRSCEGAELAPGAFRDELECLSDGFRVVLQEGSKQKRGAILSLTRSPTHTLNRAKARYETYLEVRFDPSVRRRHAPADFLFGDLGRVLHSPRRNLPLTLAPGFLLGRADA